MKKRKNILIILFLLALKFDGLSQDMKYHLDGINFAYQPTIMFSSDSLWSHGREPILRRMPDGSLISLVLSGGESEPDNENVVLIVRSYDDGISWSKPEILFNHDRRGVWATELFTYTEHPFLALHTYNRPTWYTELRAFFSYTEDSGKTWSLPKTIPGIPPNYSVREGIVLHDGTWLFPIYWQEHTVQFNFSDEQIINRMGRFVSAVIRSTDKGKTFSLHGYIQPDSTLYGPMSEFWEAAVVELTPGHLLMLIRCDNTGVLWQSESKDGGLNWSEAQKTDIPSPGTKSCLMKVKEKILLFHNPTREGREILEVWISSDHCKTWPKKIRLAEIAPGRKEKPFICYPHGFADNEKETIYLSCDAFLSHYLLKIPYHDILEE